MRALLAQAPNDVRQGTANGGVTPLHLAAWCGHDAVVAFFLDAGADPNAGKLSNGCSPLDAARDAQGHLEGRIQQLEYDIRHASVEAAGGEGLMLRRATSAA